MLNRKTKQEIEIDYTRACDQASEIERLADDLSRVANSGVEPALLVLKNNWRGDAGGSIELAGRNTSDEIYRTADTLMRVARNIRETAYIVYNAEKAAVEICY